MHDGARDAFGRLIDSVIDGSGKMLEGVGKFVAVILGCLLPLWALYWLVRFVKWAWTD